MERDSQKAKLYRAEKVLTKYAKPLPTVEAVEEFLEHIWRLKRVRSAFPRAMHYYDPPRVKDGRGTRIARGGTWHISIPLWARNTFIVTHEVSHTISRRMFGTGRAAHGWEYCAVYLKMVLFVMGREAHDTLKASMREHHVRFHPRRKRNLSPEHRAKLVAALAEARAKRAALKAA